MKKLRFGIGIAVVSALALTACTGTGAGTGDSQTAKPSYKITATTPAATQELDKVTWSTYAEPSSLDYAYAFDYASNQILSNVCESLLRLNSDLTISPGLASVFENRTPTTWVYTIREGVKFHDGTTLTADDVVASLSRHLDPAVGSYWSASFANVESITKTGEHEVTVTTRTPDSQVNLALSGAPGVVESAATLSSVGADYGNSTGGVNCTGPFALDKWKSGESLVLARFDDYWDQDLKAKSKEIDFLFMEDPNTRMNAFKSGEVDGGWLIPSNAIADLNASGAGQVYFGLNTVVNSMVVSNPEGPLGKPEVRKALLQAIDRDKLVQAAESGYGSKTNSLTPQSVWPQDDASVMASAFTDLVDYPYDVEAATQAVKDAGVAGDEITITTTPMGNAHSVVAQAVAAAAESIGLTATIKTMTPDTYTTLFSDPEARKGTDLFFNIWYLSTPDPVEMLSVLRTDEFSNYGSWSDPKYDDIVNQAIGTMDASERSMVAVGAQQILNEQVPWLPLYETPNLLWMNERITGPSPSVNFLYYPWAALIGGK